MKEFPVESRKTYEEKKAAANASRSQLLQSIREGEIGNSVFLKTPFGIKPLVYADHTASSRALTFIEDYVRDEVLPSYANTHSEASACASQTHHLREEARGIIKRCINASERDVVIFTGSGYTAAINKLIKAMKVGEITEQKNYCYENRWGSFDCVLCNMPFLNKGQYQEHEKSETHIERLKEAETKKTDKETDMTTVVFISAFEHHSNILPWRETKAIIEIIPVDDKTGDINYAVLEQKLQEHSKAKVKIGSFLGCSNIAGVCLNTDILAYLMHLHDGIAIFDMTACAPYLKLDMNSPVTSFEKAKKIYSKLDEKKYNEFAYKDAIMFSGHKFIGGVGSTGILAAKRNLFVGTSPSTPGGGTVLFVDKKEHIYVPSIEQREEGGTPDIVGCIRTGLALQLKEAVSEEFIEKRELELIDLVSEKLSKMDNVVMMESENPRKGLKALPIFSFNIKSHGKFLHYNFVVRLLNDLFGIQSRGGCACAAIYGFYLLGVPNELSHSLNQAIGKGYEILRLGAVRINFSYWIEQDFIDYIVAAIDWVSQYGWMLLPYYTFDVEKSVWKVRTSEDEEKRTWLHRIDYTTGKMIYPKGSGKFLIQDKPIKVDLGKILKEADEALKKSIEEYKHIYGKAKLDQETLFTEDVRSLRWFLLPSEVLDTLRRITGDVKVHIENCELKLPFKGGRLKIAESKMWNKEEQKESLSEKDSNEAESEFVFPNVAEEPADKPVKLLAIIPDQVYKLVGEAIKDFDMIKEGDRILVCISGGKDSLSLLHILLNLQARAPVKFELGAVTVDPQTPQYNPAPLTEYMKKLGITYYLESHNIVDQAKECMQKNSVCSFCSRMRRGVIYQCARTHKYNVIALGQHLDDLAESFMMSVLHNGRLRTMKTNYVNDKGDVRVIRPLVYCREKLFKEIAETQKLPVIVDNCPACFAAPKERHRVKLMLAQQEHAFPTIFSSLLQAMKPLMTKPSDAEDEND